MSYVKDPRVDHYIDRLPDWQQAICQEVRELIHAADPEVVETIKRTVQPYFTLDGNICALLATKDYGGARRELENAAAASEKLGLRVLLAQSRYFLATALRQTGREADASRHATEASKVLEEIRKESGSDDVLKRADIGRIAKP